MSVTVTITDDAGYVIDAFVAQPRVPQEQSLDLAHAIRDLVSQVTHVADTTPEQDQ